MGRRRPHGRGRKASSPAIPASAVQSYADLEEYLGQSLLSDYFDRSGERIRQVSTSLKTYLIETHHRRDASALFQMVFPVVQEIDGTSLLRLYDQAENEYFADIANERFPMVHTIAKTNDTDNQVRKLTSHSLADRCWIPSEMLLNASLGRVIGFRFGHQIGVDGLETTPEGRRLASDLGQSLPPAFRLQVSEYAFAEEDLQWLRQGPMRRRAALESLSWRVEDSSADGQFIHDHVWATGKVAAYGTSYAAHLNTVSRLRATYQRAVLELEVDKGLGFSASRFEGVPLFVGFSDSPVTDVGALAAAITTAKEPFRLMGVSRMEAGRAFINALDLHTGDRVDLELADDGVMIYLPAGSCGNVVMRLLSNLERHVSSQVATTFDDVMMSR